ncbi:hypothetical protein [Paracoccus aminophilus]|uniref:Uncharacterized protein n=1 Tax=Paracoccus aminophilus JCM 7686 TaxID=1367847 RepID=S5XTQ8_PARAH|nr:hypothetical protein [Paracoccus aminophilus]AGT10904.1 hypothetical protein JCM7686_pAMI4p213 [Paracoccus aminophilus JCM 7686]
MTNAPRSPQEILADQFRITAEISAQTGEYHRLLQKCAACAFARQMAEDGPASDLAEAEAAEAEAHRIAEISAATIAGLEAELSALGRELAALNPGHARNNDHRRMT